MAESKVTPSNGRFSLGGSMDTDLEGLDPDQYEVFTTDKDLDKARREYPNYDWFVCYSVKYKGGTYADVSHTLKFNRPVSGDIYAYYKNSAHKLDTASTGNKGNQARVQVTVPVGDPAIGRG